MRGLIVVLAVLLFASSAFAGSYVLADGSTAHRHVFPYPATKVWLYAPSAAITGSAWNSSSQRLDPTCTAAQAASALCDTVRNSLVSGSMIELYSDGPRINNVYITRAAGSTAVLIVWE